MQFISPPLEGLTESFLDEEESFHAVKVLRHKKGDEIKVFDGKDQYLVKIKDVKDGRVLIYDFKKILNKSKNYRINFFVPFIERKEFEEILKNLTELGVDNFIPIITEYTQKFFIPKNFQTDRLRKIVISAVKQSERDSIPNIFNPIKFNEIINFDGVFIVGWISNKHNTDIKSSLILKNTVNILVGPEGGFSENEKKIISNSDRFVKINISPNILRVKTASIALTSCVVFLFENENIF